MYWKFSQHYLVCYIFFATKWEISFCKMVSVILLTCEFRTKFKFLYLMKLNFCCKFKTFFLFFFETWLQMEQRSIKYRQLVFFFIFSFQHLKNLFNLNIFISFYNIKNIIFFGSFSFEIIIFMFMLYMI